MNVYELASIALGAAASWSIPMYLRVFIYSPSGSGRWPGESRSSVGNYIVASCEVVKFPFANSVDRVYSTHARAFVPTSVLRGADVHFGRANCAKDPMY